MTSCAQTRCCSGHVCGLRTRGLDQQVTTSRVLIEELGHIVDLALNDHPAVATGGVLLDVFKSESLLSHGSVSDPQTTR